MPLIGFLLSLIFVLLAVLHFSWAFGSKWAFDNALPQNEAGEKVLNPGKIDCIVVGLGLLAFSIFYLIKTTWLDWSIPGWLLHYAGWGIIAIFLLRAIGDFKFVGFFKKIKSTAFGKLDSQFYSPLCLSIAIFGVLVELLAIS